jgi:hypothetical protein
MSACILNKRRWLFFEWLGPHDWAVEVEPWAFGKMEANFTCKRCGCRERDFGLTEGECMERGWMKPKPPATPQGEKP